MRAMHSLLEPLHTDDGVPLHVRHWSAPGPALGNVVIVHGLGEHIGRYQALVDDLNAAGWNVCGFDLRGHGASGGARGRIPRDDSLLRDLGRVIEHLRDFREGPIVLLGHSLGGLVASRFVAQGIADEHNAPSWHRRVDALVMSSPALDLGMSPSQRALLAVMAPLTPDASVSNGIDPTWLSRSEAVVQAYRDDPLVHNRVTPRFVRFMVDAGAYVKRYAPLWSVPTLLMWGGADRCVEPQGSRAFADLAPSDWVAHAPFADFVHEIFNEPQRAQPVQTMSRWLEANFA
jgi:alpha-beta hydrolase superfamily lysophospholipase